MLTLFTTPKAFRGHSRTIQRNALQSWLALRPRPEVIVFGEDEGTAEVTEEFGIRHVALIRRSEYGAPLLHIFELAQQIASHDLLCYVNADIMLMSDFATAVEAVSSRAQRFLMAGRVWRAHIAGAWDFRDLDWETRLRSYVRRYGEQAPAPGNSDFFVFPRGLWTSMPPIAIGRGFWECWLVYEARRLRASVIDASLAVMAVHQNHDQSTYPHGLRRWRKEVNDNYRLVGTEAARFCLLDATHLLTDSGLKRPFSVRHFVRRLDTAVLFRPSWTLPLGLPRFVFKIARALRESKACVQDPLMSLTQLVLSHLPQEGITAIGGLAGPANVTDVGRSLGLGLARGLLGGGYPVVVYDPEPAAMEYARRTLGGPVEFGASFEGCVAEGDVVVLAAARDEFKRIPGQVLARKGSSRVVIDCCRLLRPSDFDGNTRYIPWP